MLAELAKSARAGCKNTECKKEGLKIEKGEIRVGTWVEIKEHGGWQWRHWYVHFICSNCMIPKLMYEFRGCTTPKILANIKENINDYDDVDGYDELEPEHKKMIEEALEAGHVPDADWRGVCLHHSKFRSAS